MIAEIVFAILLVVSIWLGYYWVRAIEKKVDALMTLVLDGRKSQESKPKKTGVVLMTPQREQDIHDKFVGGDQ